MYFILEIVFDRAIILSMGQDEIKNEAVQEDKRTPVQAAADRQLEEISDFFLSLQPGVSLLIERLQPTWCGGYLEEIQITDEGISLDYLINTWGGHLLLVKPRGPRGRLIGGSFRVPLFSFPPLRFGKRLRENDKSGRFGDDEKEMITVPQPPPAPVVVNSENSLEKIFAALPVLLPMVSQWLERSETRRREDQAMLFEIMRSQQPSPLTDVKNLGSMMKQMSEMFGQGAFGGNGGGGGDEMGFISQAMDVLKMVMDNKKPVHPVPQMPHSIPPQPSRLTAVPSTPSVTKPPQSMDLTTQLANLDPSQAAMTLIGALGKMSPEKREETERTLAALYTGQDDDGDEYDDSDDIAENES